MSSEANGTPIVEFRNVTKTFHPGTPRAFTALKEISFAVEDLPHYGEFIAILGPSGCGKSTLLNLIAGFPEVYPPTSGEVLVRGEQVSGPGRDRGMIFQRYSSFPHKTVLDNVLFGLELNAHEPSLKPVERVTLAQEWIEKVGLAEHARKYPHQLSGGQQQRVAIARTLVLKPRIILMDEPFSALDEPTRLEMQRLILELWEQVEATVFLVTHSITEAVYLGDRVWIFTQAPGQIASELKAEIPRTRGQTPFEAQNSIPFKAAVDKVAQAFRDITHQSSLT
jgi:NitT/TauT family transport system ATP-binding protein